MHVEFISIYGLFVNYLFFVFKSIIFYGYVNYAKFHIHILPSFDEDIILFAFYDPTTFKPYIG